VFIGHLPAGYLATSALLDRSGVVRETRRRLLALGLVASVAPDFDLIYFYLVGHQQRVHHAYFPHLPFFWLVAVGVASLGLRLAGAERSSWLALWVIALNVTLHLVLDSIVGGIRWLWPFSDREFRLVSVPARYHLWYWNFVLHWTFGLEVALVVAALWVFLRRHRYASVPTPSATR